MLAQLRQEVALVVLLIGPDDLHDVGVLEQAAVLDHGLMARLRLCVIDRLLVVGLQLAYESVQAGFVVVVVDLDGDAGAQVVSPVDPGV